MTIDVSATTLVLKPEQTCSDGARRFTFQGAHDLLGSLTQLEKYGAWFEDVDNSNRGFAITVREGRVYADETIRELNLCRVNVNWANFQRSINARAKWS